jgi:D-alanyl-D-alanine carboxypeptidase (penicillin-binding protein 5/6)
MGAETRDIRNNNAMRLLDWGFANYAAYQAPAPNLKGIRVTGGEFDRCDVNVAEFNCVLPKGEAASVEYKIELPESMAAPVKQGDVVGQIIYQLNGQEIGRTDILANCDIPEVSFSTLYRRLLSGILLR